VGRAGPLAIDNLMKVVGVLDVCRLQRATPDHRRVGNSSYPTVYTGTTPKSLVFNP